MSIIRIGLAETKKFAEGYESIFGSRKKKNAEEKPATDAKAEDSKKPAKARKKKKK